MQRTLQWVRRNFFLAQVSSHGIPEGFGVGGTLNISFHSPCHGQGHLPSDQLVQSPIQAGLEHFQLGGKKTKTKKDTENTELFFTVSTNFTSLWFSSHWYALKAFPLYALHSISVVLPLVPVLWGSPAEAALPAGRPQDQSSAWLKWKFTTAGSPLPVLCKYLLYLLKLLYYQKNSSAGGVVEMNWAGFFLQPPPPASTLQLLAKGGSSLQL